MDPAAERKRDAVLVEYPIDKGKAWCADTVPFLQAASLLFMENSENLRIVFDFTVLYCKW